MGTSGQFLGTQDECVNIHGSGLGLVWIAMRLLQKPSTNIQNA